MNAIKAATTIALVVFSASTLAARPTSIAFDSNGDTEGKSYAKYIVKCSNGKKAELTAWDNRKKWCVGDSSSDICEKKQINAAKDACKAR